MYLNILLLCVHDVRVNILEYVVEGEKKECLVEIFFCFAGFAANDFHFLLYLRRLFMANVWPPIALLI